MAFSGALKCRRNPEHRALAGDGAGGADDCSRTHHLDGAGTGICVFAVAVLVAVRVLGECGGGDGAGALPAGVDNRFSAGSACGRCGVAGADLDFRTGTAWTFLSFLCIRDGGSGLSLGAVGDGRHGVCGGGALVGRSARGASRSGTGGGSLVAPDASSSLWRERW